MNIQEILQKHKLWLEGDANGKCANLRNADLRNADLRYANLRNADLRNADLSNANLRNANLRNANLRNADLRNADLSNANLRNADLRNADLRYADLSGAKNLLSAINYMEAHFERTTDGYIVYKCFGGMYAAPPVWKIEPGSVVEEEVNPNRTNDCGCGINVAPLEWVCREYPNKQVYKLLIRWEWLPGVIVPYNTDGKIRCARAEIIGEVIA